MAPAGNQGRLHSEGDVEMGYEQLRGVCASVHM